MSANLLSLRLVVVSDSVEDHELFRQAAASAVTPIEIVTVGSAAAARGKLAGADLLYLDDRLSGDEIKATVAAMAPDVVEWLKKRVRARLAANAMGRITVSAHANAVKGRVPD